MIFDFFARWFIIPRWVRGSLERNRRKITLVIHTKKLHERTSFVIDHGTFSSDPSKSVYLLCQYGIGDDTVFCVPQILFGDGWMDECSSCFNVEIFSSK